MTVHQEITPEITRNPSQFWSSKEMQAAAAERTLLPLCVFDSLVSMGAHERGGNGGTRITGSIIQSFQHGIREVRAADRGRRLEEARKKPEMMAARSSVFLGQLEQSLHLQISISV